MQNLIAATPSSTTVTSYPMSVRSIARRWRQKWVSSASRTCLLCLRSLTTGSSGGGAEGALLAPLFSVRTGFCLRGARGGRGRKGLPGEAVGIGVGTGALEEGRIDEAGPPEETLWIDAQTLPEREARLRREIGEAPEHRPGGLGVHEVD